MLRNPSRYAFNEKDWLSGDTAVVTNQFIEFGRITGQAGVAYALGYGLSEGQDSANGRFYMVLKTAGAVVIDGDLRIELLDAQDKVQMIVWEGRTEQVAMGAGDRTKQLPFPLIPHAIGENYKFSFKIKADAAATIDDASSDIIMDATAYEDK